jgi:hypothetical protein
MNRSKIIGATALASVMAASAAQAEMSIGGLFAGKITDTSADLRHSFSTNSIVVSYSDSLDNGMGISVTMSMNGTNTASNTQTIVTDVNIDTGMGVIGLGLGQDSAVDAMDGSPACFSLNACGSALNANYNDGDTASGNSIAYSNSVGGIDFKVTRGMESATTNPVMSYAAGMSLMGATVKAGVSSIDYIAPATADIDPSFVTVGYSIAGLNLGYAVYDGDNGGEETQMGVGTTAMGMNVGVTFADADLATDVDYMRVSIGKGMGAASFGLDYTETDVAGTDTGDTDHWNFMYVVGF